MNNKFRESLVERLIETGIEKAEAEKEVLMLYMDFRNARNNCLNYQLQSLGADVVNRAGLAIVRKGKELGIKIYPVATIHDQWVFEVEDEEDKAETMRYWVEKLMAETTVLPGVELNAPAEIARNLYEGH